MREKTGIQLNMVLSSISNTRLWVCLTMAYHPRNSLWTTPYVVDDVDGAARKNMSVNHETRYEIMMYVSKRAVLMNWGISSVHVCSC